MVWGPDPHESSPLTVGTAHGWAPHLLPVDFLFDFQGLNPHPPTGGRVGTSENAPPETRKAGLPFGCPASVGPFGLKSEAGLHLGIAVNGIRRLDVGHTRDSTTHGGGCCRAFRPLLPALVNLVDGAH